MSFGKTIEVRMEGLQPEDSASSLLDLIREVVGQTAQATVSDVNVRIQRLGERCINQRTSKLECLTFECIIDLILWKPKLPRETLQTLAQALLDALKIFFQEKRSLSVAVVNGSRDKIEVSWKPKPKKEEST